MSTPQPPASEPPAAAASGLTRAPVEEDDSPSTWQPLALHEDRASSGFAITYVVAFIVQNSDRIKIDFVFADTNRAPDLGDAARCSALGILFGVLLSQLYRHRRRAQLAQARRQAAPTPVRISSGETKLKASRADDSPPSRG